MTTTTLYSLVHTLLQEAYDVSGNDTHIAETECVRRLAQVVRHAPDLQPLYASLFPAKTFTEAMLPLVARAVGRTIGVIDASDEVVAIPNQWFAPATRERSVDDAVDDLDSVEDDEVEVLRRTSDGYARDYDDEYVAKYEANIQLLGWSFTTDACAVDLRKGADEGASHVATPPVSATSKKASASADETDAKVAVLRPKALRHDQKGIRLYEVWGGVRPFQAHVGETAPATVRTAFAPYPAVTDPDFHPKLYRCRGMRPSDVGVRGEGEADDPSVVTLRDHQQLVRNFVSPFTPYHSLLLMHATGTGKTMTALGIAETFRDYVYSQGKQIHIACPRDEVAKEFKAYLSDAELAGGVVRRPYDDEAVATRNDLVKPMRSAYAYHIQNHGTIFPKAIRQMVGHLYRLLEAWTAVCPVGTRVQRVHEPDACFVLSHPDPVPDAQVATMRRGWADARARIAPYVGGETSGFTHTLVHNDARRGLVVRVTSLAGLVPFEREVVDTYANTLFIVDEAHNFPTDAAGTVSEGDDDADSDPHSANWRTTLLAVIGILHAYQERMRLVLLTATPMTNAETDLYTLLNLLIRNDGIEGEPVLLEHTKHASLSPAHQAQLRRCIRARVSCFESDTGKPVRLLVDQLWYNVPEMVAATKGFTVVGRDTTRVVCAPAYTATTLVKAFVDHHHQQTHKTPTSATAAAAPPVAVHVHATTLDTDKAVLAYRRSVHDAPHATRRHLLVAFHAVPHEATVAALAAFAQRWQPGIDVVHLLAADAVVAKAVTERADLRSALYAVASEHRPLWFPQPSHCPVSLYTSSRPPQCYTSDAGTLPYFFRTYLQTKATATTCAYDFGVVATPIDNDAIAPEVVHPSGRGVSYAFSRAIRNTWNVQDVDDVAYHPKIDTMLELMERQPGNVFIYTAEPRIHPAQHYARFLVFLKRVVERRFRGCPKSRLRDMHVEVLHKGTIPYLNKREGNPFSLPTELNERVKKLNETLLATRDDVVLIGSQEVMEGLTFHEVRQVHILDPLWHMAAMEQVMGRAIRIRCHRKRPVAERNVACFLHVSVPADPFDTRLGDDVVTRANRPRKANGVPTLARCVGDLHAYYQVHKKVPGIERLLQQIRTDALDAVYRSWRPSLDPLATVVTANTHAQRSLSPKHRAYKRSGKHRATGTPVGSDGRTTVPGWRVHVPQASVDQVRWYETMKTRRALYGLLLHADEVDTPEMSATAARRLTAIRAAVPRARHELRNEIDWYRRQIVRVFERVRTPALTFDAIVARLRPYGSQQVVVTQPVAIAVDVEAVCRRFGVGPVDDLDALLMHTGASAAQAHALKIGRYAQFKWHAEATATGYKLRVDSASVVALLRACVDVPTKLADRVAAKDGRPLDVTVDTDLCRAIAALPTSLREAVSDVCTPKWLDTTDVPAMHHVTPRSLVGSRVVSRTRRRSNRAGRTPTVRAPSVAKAHRLTDLRVLNIHPEAVAYALEDVVRQRLCIEHYHHTPSTLVFEDPVYVLEPLAVPRPLTMWHTPDAVTGTMQSLPCVPYSTPLPTTTEMTDDVLRAVLLEVHAVSEWLRECTGATGPVVRVDATLTATARQWLPAVAFDALPFEYQDALLRLVAVHGFEATDDTEHPFHKETAVQHALLTVRSAVEHRYAEKRADQTCFPPGAATLLHDTFGKTVQARVFCTYPRNPATEACAVHVYTHTRFTGKTVVKPFARYTLDKDAARQWTAYFCPVPIVQTDTDVHARFLPSTDARLPPSCSQPPIVGPTRCLGYGEVLNYKDQASAGFVYRFVDATLCNTTEKSGLPLTDDRVSTRFTEAGDATYAMWETAWRTAFRECPLSIPPRFCAPVDPVGVARVLRLRSKGAYVRYFFPGVQPQHPLTRQLYAGWRARKK